VLLYAALIQNYVECFLDLYVVHQKTNIIRPHSIAHVFKSSYYLYITSMSKQDSVFLTQGLASSQIRRQAVQSFVNET
jgi:hypothetical protein